MTEQYPKALGNTVAELLEVLPPSTKAVAKTDFTMLGILFSLAVLQCLDWHISP